MLKATVLVPHVQTSANQGFAGRMARFEAMAAGYPVQILYGQKYCSTVLVKSFPTSLHTLQLATK